jgi:hypothetical protein
MNDGLLRPGRVNHHDMTLAPSSLVSLRRAPRQSHCLGIRSKKIGSFAEHIL